MRRTIVLKLQAVFALDEATVTKAAKYMMSLTYPEAPRG